MSSTVAVSNQQRCKFNKFKTGWVLQDSSRNGEGSFSQLAADVSPEALVNKALSAAGQAQPVDWAAPGTALHEHLRQQQWIAGERLHHVFLVNTPQQAASNIYSMDPKNVGPNVHAC